MAPSTEMAALHVENVGGIESTDVSLAPGVSVLTGRNATNRTSLLQGLMAALGSEAPSLKSDTATGSVELALDGETYTRTLTRESGTVTFDGSPYLDEDVTVADLFAFLLESNEARQAVADDADLRELLMRPVDTDSIQRDIASLRSERREIVQRLDDLSTLEADLPDLQARRDELDAEIDSVESELEAARQALEQATETATTDGELTDRLEALQERTSELDEVRFELEAERDSLDAVRAECADLDRSLSTFPEAPDEELAEVASELADCRERKQRLDSEITELQQTIQFNERMLDGGDLSVAQTSTADRTEADGVVCWTCGSAVDPADVERTVEQLRTLQSERREERATVQERIDALLDRQAELEESKRQREELRQRHDDLLAERAERARRVETLEQRRADLQSAVEDARDAVGSRESPDQSDTLDRHRAVNRAEFELEQLRADRSAVVEEIDDLQRELDQRADLLARREDIDAEIESLRGRIERLERTAVAEFNDHMSQVLDILDYTRLARIWIERQPESADSTGTALSESRFVLHIVRRTDDGTTYEDVIDHLSESEREVTGLVFALAGYLVHEVYETVPFMLLDSLEAIDSERISKLVGYVRPYTDFLVVALLPEDARALPDSYHRIRNV
ncbi:archaea-specific SMC-related protein [Haloarcula pellucida]|nr:archaea-specific SMC-related protein [Halomicroarcula pellucida]MBX0349631.1 AAA family ATPase [Halomicroarcula pellucida]